MVLLQHASNMWNTVSLCAVIFRRNIRLDMRTSLSTKDTNVSFLPIRLFWKIKYTFIYVSVDENN